MSSFPASRTLQLPLISAIRPARLWTQDCVLCLEAAGERLVCPACEAGLAAIGRPCPGCALPLPPGGTCAPCRRHPRAFDAAVARFEYRFPVDRLVQRFKYAGDLALGRWLALQLAEHVRGLPRPDLLVAPPLAPQRLRERGFNQAVELARTLGRELGVRQDITGLRRGRSTVPQAGLGRRARQANLRGAFECRRAYAGLHVAIVDDVMTTGATAHTLARVLKAAGAERVSVWAVARAPDVPPR
jgi:ComF family protein